MKLYVETGLFPAECIVKRRQLSFWLHLKESSMSNLLLQNILQKASVHDIHYIKYYENLELAFKNPLNAQRSLEETYTSKWADKISEAVNIDRDCKLATYHEVNPTLIPWEDNN